MPRDKTVILKVIGVQLVIRIVDEGNPYRFWFATIDGAQNSEVEGIKAQTLQNPIFLRRYRVYPCVFIVSKGTQRVRRGGIRRSLQNEGVLTKTLIASVFEFFRLFFSF